MCLQVSEFINYILKPAPGHPRLPHWEDHDVFCETVDKFVSAETRVWNTMTKTPTKLVDISRLRNVLKRRDRPPSFWEEQQNLLIGCVIVVCLFLFMMHANE